MSQQLTPPQAGMLWLATIALALACALATPIVSSVQHHAFASAANSHGLLVQTRHDTAHEHY